jgi:hypothetical protein
MLQRLSDRALATVSSAVLLALSAWPLSLARVPPLQDLPQHLATAVVIRHPEAYPGFVFRGFFKTNATLFLWLHLFGEEHLYAAAKAFVLLVLGAHAWVLPRLVLELGGRERVVPATFVAWPLVHGWFVCMGMLDYALGSALGLALLLLAAREQRAGSWRRRAGMAALAALTWYTHVFALAIVALLAVLDGVASAARAEPGARASAARRTLRVWAPLAPGVALSAWSFAVELGRTRPHSEHGLAWRPPWEIAYELFAKHAWAFSELELFALLPFGVLAWSLFRERRRAVPMLGPLAAATLLALHFAVPNEALDWFAVSTRFLPFLYACALVRVPERLPRALLGALGAFALAWSAGMGVDYWRLGRELDELASGTGAVPEGATLLPLVFEPKGSSENTWALVHGWGLYVVERRTSAPLLFAHSPSFPVTYAKPPPPELHGLRLGSFAQRSHSPEEWRTFLEGPAAGFDRVLTWGALPEGFDAPRLRVAYAKGRLRVWERR